MTPLDLEREVLDVLRNFWRMRAALIFLRQEAESKVTALGRLTVRFDNVPNCSVAPDFLHGETLDTTLSGIASFEQSRMRNDVLLAMISRIELYFSDRLAALGRLPSDATLGRLQRLCESMAVVPRKFIESFDEVRERRNVIIHHHGIATARYAQAASRIPSLSSLLPGVSVVTDESYLSYAADVLVQYGRYIP
ncbi:hypothetical protein [Sorangium sp. So ce1153]|uniref:hypothetical protein n=1 Tax=Sorangium sp. So ce1153 TaxID=3133333 RepID=UPI003F637BB8